MTLVELEEVIEWLISDNKGDLEIDWHLLTDDLRNHFIKAKEGE